MSKRQLKNDHIILSTLEQLVPQDHEVRKLEEAIDWQFIYPLVEDLYSVHGRPSIDPVILFKMLFINFIFGINSMRKTCKEIQVNLAYRWFLGLAIDEPVPNYSTWSQNYIRRYGSSDVFEKIFDHILRQAMDYGYVDVGTIFGDSTHQKASANKNKYEDKEVAIVKKVYEDELLEEINEDRKEHGKKPFQSIHHKELNFDEKTGNEKEDKDKKHIKISKTDPESGHFHKGEKEKCFAYSHQTFCDRHGFVLGSICVPGNVHDSVSFFDAYNVLNKKFPDQIKNVCLDAGYVTPAICRKVLTDEKTLYVPYKRPMTKKGYFKKYEYIYDEDNNCYICPNKKILKYTTTNREGYKRYVSNPDDCINCPFRNKCTQSKNHQKVISRHVWEGYKETVNEIRLTPKWKEIYPQRKENIERVFADCKENHGLRYTRLKGLKKNQHQVLIIFACHNLKRIAKWRWESLLNTIKIRIFSIKMMINQKNRQKEKQHFIRSATLSTI